MSRRLKMEGQENTSDEGSSVDADAADHSGPKCRKTSEEEKKPEDSVEVGKEAKEDWQEELVEADSAEEVRTQTLRKINEEMSKFSKYPVNNEVLKDSIRDSSVDPNKLLHFWSVYNNRSKKDNKGRKRGEGSEVSAHRGGGFSLPDFLCRAAVKIFPLITGQTFGAHDVILEKLHGRRFMQRSVERTTVRQESDIIIIFCPVTSRVGADVGAAMRKVTDDKPAILVVMHHTRDADYSMDLKRWSDHCRNVILDVHVLFHETLPGLLECPRNDRAIQQIQSQLKKMK